MSKNIPNNSEEKFRSLEHLPSREAGINREIRGNEKIFQDSVSEILDHTADEIENIDNLMEIVFEIDDMIEGGEDFTNHLAYNKFMSLYFSLSQKEKKHFTEVYSDFRIVYYFRKISNNIKNGGNLKLANITLYLNQFKNENFPEEYIDKFWLFFNDDERKFLLDYFEK